MFNFLLMLPPSHILYFFILFDTDTYAFLQHLNIHNVNIRTLLMCLCNNYFIYDIYTYASTDHLCCPFWVIFSCFACFIIFDSTVTTVNFTFLCMDVSSLDTYWDILLNYLETLWFFWSLILSFGMWNQSSDSATCLRSQP